MLWLLTEGSCDLHSPLKLPKMLTYAVISSDELPWSWSYKIKSVSSRALFKPSGYWCSGSESVLSRFLASFQRLEIKVHTDCKIAKKFYSEDLKATWYCRSERSMPSRVTAATCMWVNPQGPTKTLWTLLYGFQIRRNWLWRGMM